MHRVDPQITWLASWLRFAPFANGHLYGACFGVVQAPLAVPPTLSQVVNVRHRDRRKPLVLSVSVELPFPFQNFLRRWSAHRLMRFIHVGQQFQVRLREAALKAVAPVVGFLHFAVFQISADQPRYQARGCVPSSSPCSAQQPSHHLALRSVAPLSQQPRDPLVYPRRRLP